MVLWGVGVVEVVAVGVVAVGVVVVEVVALGVVAVGVVVVEVVAVGVGVVEVVAVEVVAVKVVAVEVVAVGGDSNCGSSGYGGCNGSGQKLPGWKKGALEGKDVRGGHLEERENVEEKRRWEPRAAECWGRHQPPFS